MRSVSVLSALAAASAVQAGPTKTHQQKPRAVSIEPVTATGNAFFVGDTRFFVRGVAYQPGGSAANLDPLADPDVCMPDIEKFKKLKINVVRVYSTDNSKDHSECMNALAEAGIYVALDANNPLYSINRADPGPSYNPTYLQSVFATIDEFAKYDNTMAFFSGNEVIHDEKESTLAARYVKATTRDMRQYIRERGYRKILVGYSAADVSQNRMQTAHYFNCGTDDERSDFFAFNDYSWCSSDFKTSGWDVKVRNFTGYGIPIFLSEYGCNTNVRDFGEVEALMSDQMTAVYSGGLMYEYTMEDNKYGIVSIPDKAQKGTRKELPEFANYAKALAENPSPTDAEYSKTSSSVACPAKDDNWMVETTLLPAMPEGAKVYLKDGAGPGPGLDGPGSQTAGGGSTDDAAPGSGGSGSSGSTKGSGGAANQASLVLSGAALVFTVFGAALL